MRVETANIFIYAKGSENLEVWTAGKQAYSNRFLIPIASAPHFKTVVDAIRKRKELVTWHYTKKEKNKILQYWLKHTAYKEIPPDRRRVLLTSQAFTLSVGISKNIGIQINNYSIDAFTDAENNILVRFSKVFEQAYTRFLDLQKAEAQAREAEIELALERVRVGQWL